LDYSRNQLEALPVGLVLCTNLRALFLGNNKLTVVDPDLFENLKKLEELQLYKNKLTVLPAEIGHLKGE
jgi:Leucine-rich repeat (LRR) protein